MPTDPTRTEPTPTDSATTDPTTTDPTAAEQAATDRVANGPIADATGRTDPERGEPDPSGASVPNRECGKSAADPDRIAELERRMTDLEAELDAVRGLLDGVEAVDERVERRASAAMAKAEALEERFAPEEPELVRERLPDAGGDVRREDDDGDPLGRRRTPDRDPDTDPGPRAGSQSRDRSDQDIGRHSGTASAPEGDAGAVGNARTRPADANATDEGSAGTGAISSVGSRAPDDAGPADDSDRSLAARLRDAFR